MSRQLTETTAKDVEVPQNLREKQSIWVDETSTDSSKITWSELEMNDQWFTPFSQSKKLMSLHLMMLKQKHKTLKTINVASWQLLLWRFTSAQLPANHPSAQTHGHHWPGTAIGQSATWGRAKVYVRKQEAVIVSVSNCLLQKTIWTPVWQVLFERERERDGVCQSESDVGR